MFKSLLLLSFLLIVPAVRADPITFDFGTVVALQNAGFTNVNLNAPNLLLAPTTIDLSGLRTLNVGFDITVIPAKPGQES